MTLARGYRWVSSSLLPTYRMVLLDTKHNQKGTPAVQGVRQLAELFFLKLDLIMQAFFIPSELMLEN